MKSVPRVTLLIAAAFALLGLHALGQQPRGSARGATGLPELPARRSLFGGLLEPGVEIVAGIGDGKKQDLDLIQALEGQVHALDACFRFAEVEYKTETRSVQDLLRVGYELNAAKAELAWAQADANGALLALEETLRQADLEIEAWGGRKAQGLLVAPEGAQQRRVAAARTLARVQRILGLQQQEAAGQQAADPSPDRPREPAQTPASEPAEALREHVRFLDESFKRVEALYTERMESPQSVAQTGYELNAAKAKLAWAQGDANEALASLEKALAHADRELEQWRKFEAAGLPTRGRWDPRDARVPALKRRVEAVRALDRVKATLARQEAAAPLERTPDHLPEVGAAGRQSAARPGPEVLQALRQLVDFLHDYHKRSKAQFELGTLAPHEFHWVGYEWNAARAELAWARGDPQAASESLKEALARADDEIEGCLFRERQGWFHLDLRIAAVRRRGDALKALARVKRHLARQQVEATSQQTPPPSKPLPR